MKKTARRSKKNHRKNNRKTYRKKIFKGGVNYYLIQNVNNPNTVDAFKNTDYVFSGEFYNFVRNIKVISLDRENYAIPKLENSFQLFKMHEKYPYNSHSHLPEIEYVGIEVKDINSKRLQNLSKLNNLRFPVLSYYEKYENKVRVSIVSTEIKDLCCIVPISFFVESQKNHHNDSNFIASTQKILIEIGEQLKQPQSRTHTKELIRGMYECIVDMSKRENSRIIQEDYNKFIPSSATNGEYIKLYLLPPIIGLGSNMPSNLTSELREQFSISSPTTHPLMKQFIETNVRTTRGFIIPDIDYFRRCMRVIKQSFNEEIVTDNQPFTWVVENYEQQLQNMHIQKKLLREKEKNKLLREKEKNKLKGTVNVQEKMNELMMQDEVEKFVIDSGDKQEFFIEKLGDNEINVLNLIFPEEKKRHSLRPNPPFKIPTGVPYEESTIPRETWSHSYDTNVLDMENRPRGINPEEIKRHSLRPNPEFKIPTGVPYEESIPRETRSHSYETNVLEMENRPRGINNDE